MNPINHTLVSNGWRIWTDQFGEPGDIAFAQSFDGHAECKCNQGKRKQVEVYYHPRKLVYGCVFNESWTVKCVGQLPDNEWLRMHVENLENLEAIERTVQTLLTIWDEAVKITPYIEQPD